MSMLQKEETLPSLISLITENAAKTAQIFGKNVSSTSTHMNTNSLNLQKICSIVLHPASVDLS